MSVIDLTFTTPELKTLDSWIIDEELATLSEYEFIVFDIANLNETVSIMGMSQKVIVRAIKVRSEDKKEEVQKG